MKTSSCSRPTLRCSRLSGLRPKLLPVLSQTAHRQQFSHRLTLRVRQARRRLISQRALQGLRALTVRAMPISPPNDISYTLVFDSTYAALIAVKDCHYVLFIASPWGPKGLGLQGMLSRLSRLEACWTCIQEL